MTTLALIHPNDLLAVELRERLDRRPDLWHELRLLGTSEEEVGTLTEIRGAAAMVQPLEPASLEGVDVVFLCGPRAGDRILLEGLPAAATTVVLAPDAGPEVGPPVVAGVNEESAIRGGTVVSPHPGTVALAHLLHPLLPFRPRRADVTLVEPVSIHGKAGLDEMFEQTRRILAFQSPEEPRVLPTQLAFNLLPAPGAPRAAIEAHLRTVLGDTELTLTLRLLRAGVFHGYGVSVYLELAEDPGTGAVVEALAGHPYVEMAEEPELLGPIVSAGHERVVVGTLEPAGPGGFHLWAVMDNLTCGGAGNALRILESISQQVTH
jgi:aspartate-semialdehyde dehydrogenase